MAQAEQELRIPQNGQAERAILGNLMLDASRMRLCERVGLTARDFFLQSSRDVFAVMTAHSSQHALEYDPVSLCAYLRREGTLERVGGPAAVADLFSDIPRFWTDETFLRQVELVLEASRLRALLARANKAMADIADGELDSQKIADDLSSLAKEVEKRDAMPPELADLVMDAIERLNNRQNAPSHGLEFGPEALDAMTGGLQKGHLCFLAARPSGGKTSLALQWTGRVLRSKKPVAFFSFEMSAQEIIDRLMMLDAAISSDGWRRGGFNASEFQRWQETSGWMPGAPFHLRDRIPPTLTALESEARDISKKVTPALIVVDYLQLMSPGQGARKSDNRNLELSQITRGLKQLARELACPILVLSQLNRAIEGRHDDKPRLSDLRDSGSIEQDADQVIFITHGNDLAPPYHHVKLHLAKNRHGRSGEIDIAFNTSTGAFDW